MKPTKEFRRFILIPAVLLLGILLTAAFMVFYSFTARTADGKIISSRWPHDFTMDFAQYISFSGEAPAVSADGQNLLRQNGLWLQILSPEGQQVLALDKPDTLPERYQPYALTHLYQYGTDGYSVFLGELAQGGETYVYLVGFPLSISKVTMYVDNARYSAGRVWIVVTALLTAVLVLALTVYSGYVSAAAERQRKKDEQAKTEWLANTTHDLKTPLAPLRGYAELLADATAQPDPAQVQKYGQIMLKNALYTQQLVDDLKLTYQLQSGMLPLQARQQNLTRFVREVVIDILNTPEYEERNVTFLPERENAEYCFDAQLLRRALDNIIINSLKHNSPEVSTAISLRGENGFAITVKDNGCGMTQTELDGLFARYYRGTSTEVKAEGSGLGMAIARQIIEAHGGTITAQSAPGVGTEITIRLPAQN
ncbi:MAG: HAMP domain-containing histidine kinase [Faecalibacterium sp.]|jgi:signal transduction histidine kinase|nr:HAMP domain-containing histidine kinase [Faecalibacterium sp.]